MNVHPHSTRRSRLVALVLAPAMALGGLAMPVAHAEQVIMFWDKPGPYETESGIEATGGLEVPAEACGFRLGRHGETWSGGWHFGTYNNQGEPLQRQGITYSSSFTGPAEGPIEARGPVHGCSSGVYAFTTPLGQYGITGDAPVTGNPPAGSFVADVFDGSDLEWLDAAGQPIKTQPGFGPDPKPPTLPPEFLQGPPTVGNCIRDFGNKYHCLDGPSQSPVASAGTRMAARPGVRQDARQASGEDVVQMSARIPAPPTGARQASAAEAVEVDCPVELVLTGSIRRNPAFEPDPSVHSEYGMDPPVVEYRFRFVPEHVASTRFQATLDQAVTEVTHSVPLPLPPPVGSTPTGTPQPGSRTLRALLPGDDGGRGGAGGPGTPVTGAGDMAAQMPPEDVMQGTVRLELLNLMSHAGEPVAMASSPTAYAVRCVQDPGPQPTRPVITTGVPVPPPQQPSDMRAPAGTRAAPAQATTCRGGQVRGGSCVCPSGMRAIPAGSADQWQCVPAPGRR